MTESKKANEDLLNALHFMTATELAKLLKDAENNDQKLRVLREIRGFLKDNRVEADIEVSRPLQQLEDSAVKVESLPFGDDEDETNT